MLTEEYHAQSDSYFHNEYPLAYNNKDIDIRQVNEDNTSIEHLVLESELVK